MTQRTEQEQVRFEKLAALRASGFSYPNHVKVTATAQEVIDGEALEPDAATRVTIAGRIVQVRHMGKASFAHLLDGSGKIQIYVKQEIIGQEPFQAFKGFDIGDLVAATGYGFVTKTGEKSLFVESIELLSKGLIPLPEKWHGLTDIEARYRYRYVDLISNPEVRNVFRKRSAIIRAFRKFLDDQGYLEVETPVLHYTAGGATARPFDTHYNALDTDMVLRIALELPLKKLVVGGLERVYEIGRVFRNEGLSKKHNPEFTMLEFYQAYATFEDLMDLTEALFAEVVSTVNGSLEVVYQGRTIDFTPPFKRLSMVDSIHDIGGVDRSVSLEELDAVHRVAAEHSIKLDEPSDWGRSIEALWGALVEPKIVDPTFITHHPFSISPLARKTDANPRVTDRFELIVAGMEMANAFSELNDPVDQRERFEAQAARKAGGDLEASPVDEDFLRALEYGLPPTGGEGIGIDRFIMLLTDSASIRDVLLFPQLKPIADEPVETAETPGAAVSGALAENGG